MQGMWAQGQRIYRGCGLVEGGKEPIFGFQLGTLFGKCFAGMAFCPQRVVDGWDHLMHARRVSKEKLKALSIQARGKDSQQN